jgi:hypothetical protein
MILASVRLTTPISLCAPCVVSVEEVAALTAAVLVARPTPIALPARQCAGPADSAVARRSRIARTMSLASTGLASREEILASGRTTTLATSHWIAHGAPIAVIVAIVALRLVARRSRIARIMSLASTALASREEILARRVLSTAITTLRTTIIAASQLLAQLVPIAVIVAIVALRMVVPRTKIARKSNLSAITALAPVVATQRLPLT